MILSQKNQERVLHLKKITLIQRPTDSTVASVFLLIRPIDAELNDEHLWNR